MPGRPLAVKMAVEDVPIVPAELSLPELLILTVDEALATLLRFKRVRIKLQTLHDLGLG